MARQLKPYKVDQIQSPDGITSADVMFDRNEKYFFVEVVPGDRESRVVSNLLEEVKREASEALGRNSNIEWTPMIFVEFCETWNHGSNEHAGIKLDFRRFERATSPADRAQFLERHHCLDIDERYRARRTDRPFHYSGPSKLGSRSESNGGVEVLLEYDEAIWAGLCRIKEAIELSREKLTELFERKDVAQRLAAPLSILALPEPKRARKSRTE